MNQFTRTQGTLSGVSLIYGPAGSGKTYLLERISETLECNVSRVLVDEPEIRDGWLYPANPGKGKDSVNFGDDPTTFSYTGEQLVNGLMDLIKQPNSVVFIDSISSVLLRTGKDFSTGKGGVNSGVFIYLAAMNRAALKHGTTVYGVINPHLTDVSPDALEGVVQRLIEKEGKSWTARGRFNGDREIRVPFRPGMEIAERSFGYKEVL